MDKVLADISLALTALLVMLTSVSTDVARLMYWKLKASVSENLNIPLSLEICTCRLFPDSALRSASPSVAVSVDLSTLTMDSVSVPRAWNRDWKGIASSGAPVVLTS